METRIIAINHDGGAGEFSLQGACATPVNAKEETHASTFGHVLAGCMADTHRRYAAGSGQDGQAAGRLHDGPSLEVCKR